MDVYNMFRHLVLIILDTGYFGGTVQLTCMGALPSLQIFGSAAPCRWAKLVFVSDFKPLKREVCPYRAAHPNCPDGVAPNLQEIALSTCNLRNTPEK